MWRKLWQLHAGGYAREDETAPLLMGRRIPADEMRFVLQPGRSVLETLLVRRIHGQCECEETRVVAGEEAGKRMGGLNALFGESPAAGISDELAWHSHEFRSRSRRNVKTSVSVARHSLRFLLSLSRLPRVSPSRRS